MGKLGKAFIGAGLAAVLAGAPQKVSAQNIQDLQFTTASTLPDSRAENEQTVRDDFAGLVEQRNEIIRACEEKLRESLLPREEREMIQGILKDLELVDLNRVGYVLKKERFGIWADGNTASPKTVTQCGYEVGRNLSAKLGRQHEFSLLRRIAGGIKNDGSFDVIQEVTDGFRNGGGDMYVLLVDMRGEMNRNKIQGEYYAPFDNDTAERMAKARIADTAGENLRAIVQAVIQHSVDCTEFEHRSRLAENSHGKLDSGTTSNIQWILSYEEEIRKQESHLRAVSERLNRVNADLQYTYGRLESKNR